jgi:PAS domain S-box-containing protein
MAININKLFTFLSIKKKLVIAFVGLCIVPLLIVGFYSAYLNVTTMQETAVENVRHDVAIVREKSAQFLSGVEKDMHFLDEWCSNGAMTNEFQLQLLTFARNRNIYYQIRFINPSGDELFRIGSDTENGYAAAPVSELRHARETYYFLLTDKIAPDQIAFAPVEMIKEQSRLIPVVTCAKRVFNKKSRAFEGIVIVDIFANEFFKVIEEHHIKFGGKIVLVSNSGYYLYHPDKKNDWNRLVASQAQVNIFADYSPEIASQILSWREGTALIGMDEIIAYAPLFEFSKTNHLSDSYFIFESVSQKIIFGHIKSFALMFLGIMVVFIGTAIFLGSVATHQFTRPIDQLRKGVEIISNGDYNYRLRVESNDEIEILARQFNIMADSLQSREKVINEYKSRLEQMVDSRTEELNHKKNELQMILDNVPSAFVMLDKALRIQSASAALKHISGFSPEKVEGKSCFEILGHDEVCEICPSRKAMDSGRVESNIETRKYADGEDRYFEHVSIPIRTDNEITSMLEVITDVTGKKKLEEHLILSEKLAATGEMAATIAHQIRNSLTSVKMILQLEAESEPSSRTDKKSIAVALNSIDHMESIVNDLLHFARPSPMQFKKGALNKVLEDSISFARLQFEERGIKVIEQFGLDLPVIRMDENYLRESFVNLIINAHQAIKGDGEIRIKTEAVRLTRTLKELAYNNDFDRHHSRSEVVLESGAHVIKITFQDTGCGMGGENLKRIFDPFFTMKTGGTGLGLPMVKRTVNAHRGIINVESTLGKGSEFIIYLPIHHEWTA